VDLISQGIIYSFNYTDIKRNSDANDLETTFQILFKASKYLKEAVAGGIELVDKVSTNI